MYHIIGTAAATLAALLPSVGEAKPQPKPAPAPAGTVIVRLLPGAVKTDGDYAVDPAPVPEGKTPDERYEEMKKILDERFQYMFDLKKGIEAQQASTSAKWDEYYALRDAYEKQLKKIVADWVTDTHYQNK